MTDAIRAFDPDTLSDALARGVSAAPDDLAVAPARLKEMRGLAQT